MTISQAIRTSTVAAELAGRAREFINLARCIALSRGDPSRVKAIQSDNKVLLGPRVAAIIDSPFRPYSITPAQQKAAVAAIGNDSGLAEFNSLASSFLISLRQSSAFDRILPFTKQVPFRTRVGAVSLGAVGSTVPQASAKPISRLTLTSGTIEEIKIAAILIMTQELAQFSADPAGDLFAQELSGAIATASDSELANQLISGATSFTSNGVTAEHSRVDLRGLLAAVTTSSQSRLFLLTTSAIAKAMSVLHTNAGDSAYPGLGYNGGTIANIEVVVSDGVPAGDMILVDAAQLACASTGITLDSSEQATIQMDSGPDSPVSGSTNIVSLWQQNFAGLRAERWVGIEKLTSTAAAVVTSVSYSGDSPGP